MWDTRTGSAFLELDRLLPEEHQSSQLRGHFPHADTPTNSIFVSGSRLSAELNDDDRLSLRQAIQRINELLAPAKVTEFEPERMGRRERFRIDQVDTVIQTLGGRPREFADSFQRVDDLIDLVAIEVLG